MGDQSLQLRQLRGLVPAHKVSGHASHVHATRSAWKTNPSIAAEVANETSTNVLMGSWSVDKRLMYTALSKTKGASEPEHATAPLCVKARSACSQAGIRAFEQAHSGVEVNLLHLNIVLANRLSILIQQANNAQSTVHSAGTKLHSCCDMDTLRSVAAEFELATLWIRFKPRTGATAKVFDEILDPLECWPTMFFS
jgi:hypothetical protein